MSMRWFVTEHKYPDDVNLANGNVLYIKTSTYIVA